MADIQAQQLAATDYIGANVYAPVFFTKLAQRLQRYPGMLTNNPDEMDQWLKLAGQLKTAEQARVKQAAYQGAAKVQAAKANMFNILAKSAGYSNGPSPEVNVLYQAALHPELGTALDWI